MKNAIDTDRLLNWLVENSVLSIALEGKRFHKDTAMCFECLEMKNFVCPFHYILMEHYQ